MVFIDRLIRDIIFAEYKVVSRSSQPGAVVAWNPRKLKEIPVEGSIKELKKGGHVFDAAE